MYNINEISGLITERLEKEQFLSAPVNLYEPIEYIMSLGGKRLRPMLTILAAQMYGKSAEEVLDAAIGIEVFHNFTLVHDDIMDNAPIRRGKPTIHTKWDVNTAILSGDTMMVMAYELLLRNSPPNIKDILETFNETAREVCEGQQYDMDFEKRLDVTIDEYMNMIRLKTSVLIAAALKIGALYANAPKSDIERLYSFGEKIGLAFQLKDDLLDVYGDSDKFGKQRGNDIITNKKTYLLVSCLAMANSQDMALLQKWLKENKKPAEKIVAVTELYNKYYIKEKTNNTIDELYKDAVSHLAAVKLPDNNKAPLYNLTDTLKKRDY